MRPGESPNEAIGWLLLWAFASFLICCVWLGNSCSLFEPVASQVAIVQPLCEGCFEVFDVNDGLPLLSTPHRMVVWRDEKGDYHYAPETSEANVFSQFNNVPAFVSSALPTAAGTAVGK